MRVAYEDVTNAILRGRHLAVGHTVVIIGYPRAEMVTEVTREGEDAWNVALRKQERANR